jgi:ABC-type transport system involved in cytochrome bd biosynthesis fused ATPase/permease subunit
MMSERRIACLSLTIITTIANHLASVYVDGWSGYFSGIATAANLSSYMFQALLAIRDFAIRRRLRAKRYDPYYLRLLRNEVKQ